MFDNRCRSDRLNPQQFKRYANRYRSGANIEMLDILPALLYFGMMLFTICTMLIVGYIQ